MTDLGTKALQKLLRETEKRLGLVQSIDQKAKDLLRLKKFIQRIAAFLNAMDADMRWQRDPHASVLGRYDSHKTLTSKVRRSHVERPD